MLTFSEIYNALNVSAITALIGEYPTGTPAIFSDTLLPQDFTGTGINFYLSDSYDARNDFDIFTFTVNCRAAKYNDAVTLGNTVLNEINRKSYNGYYISCFMLPVISPIDDTDDYNCIIQATVKKR